QHEHDRVLGYCDRVRAAIDRDRHTCCACAVKIESVVAGAHQLYQLQAHSARGDQSVCLDVTDKPAQEVRIQDRRGNLLRSDVAEDKLGRKKPVSNCPHVRVHERRENNGWVRHLHALAAYAGAGGGIRIYDESAMDLELRGKVGLVTGGSRGIGRSIALRLASEGVHVSICGRTAETLDRSLTELRGLEVRAHGVVADVTQAGEVERFVQESAAVLGGVDLLVANVGGSAGQDLLASTPEDWAQTFELNLFHAVRAIRAAIPYMQQRGGGSVVSISSISGWKPGPRAQYGASKAGEIFLAGALAWELAPMRVRVNTVSPGSIMFA